jgi:uncharacterized NAD(P)/FAD-binding protein YdhS
MQDRSKHTLIIGAGLAGTAVAIRMLHYASEPQDITLLEERDDYRHGGVAYSATGLGWEHVFNIQAGRMSVFREAPDDFINWANNEADRSVWPDNWRDTRFHESSAAPRRIFQDYLKTRLDQAKANAVDGVTLHVMHGKAVDLVETGDHADVSINSNQQHKGEKHATKIVKADKVVIATGHEEQEPEVPSLDTVEFYNRQIKRVRRLYSEEGRQAILNVDKHATVYIKGSFLTAYDAAATLLKNGHKGFIVFNSRSGKHPWDYPKNHKHAVITIPEPKFVSEDLPIDERIKLAFRELDEALLANARPEVSDQENNVWMERVLKAWEPHVANLMKKLSTEEARKLSHAFGVLSRVRVGMMPEVVDQINNAKMTAKDGAFHQVIDIQDVDAFLHLYAQDVRAKQGVDPSVSQIAESIYHPDLIIENIPRQADYTKVNNPLWRKLMDERHAAIPHRKTGQGVQLDADYRLIAADGKSSNIVYVAGIPAEGHERETKGRIGAFAFNLAAVKDQSFLIANHVLGHTRQPVMHAISVHERQKAAPALYPAIASMASRYTTFFAAKTKLERNAARRALESEETHLALALRSVNLEEGSIKSLLYEALTTAREAASNQITDISITPRELNSRLKRQIA